MNFIKQKCFLASVFKKLSFQNMHAGCLYADISDAVFGMLNPNSERKLVRGRNIGYDKPLSHRPDDGGSMHL
jgi:hypothetical protein